MVWECLEATKLNRTTEGMEVSGRQEVDGDVADALIGADGVLAPEMEASVPGLQMSVSAAIGTAGAQAVEDKPGQKDKKKKRKAGEGADGEEENEDKPKEPLEEAKTLANQCKKEAKDARWFSISLEKHECGGQLVPQMAEHAAFLEAAYAQIMELVNKGTNEKRAYKGFQRVLETKFSWFRQRVKGCKTWERELAKGEDTGKPEQQKEKKSKSSPSAGSK